MSAALAEPHPTTTDVRTHYVYRLFDRAGALLYVGMTVDPKTRFADHASKPWWGDVSDRLLEETPTRADAFYLEALAILSENPRYNLSIPTYDRLDELHSRATEQHGGISPQERIAALEARLRTQEREKRANLAGLKKHTRDLAEATATIKAQERWIASLHDRLVLLVAEIAQLKSQGKPREVQRLQGQLEDFRKLHKDSVEREEYLVALLETRSEARIFIVEAPKCHVSPTPAAVVPAPAPVAATTEPTPNRWRSMFARRTR